MKCTTIQNQSYLILTWEDMGKQLLALVQKILKQKKKYDRVVALAKGGLTWSRALVDYLGIEKLSSVQIQFYTGIGETNKTPVVIQSLPISVQGERVLVFDDVADSGETLDFAKTYLKMHGAKSVDTATLTIKPWTKFTPDYYALSSKDWIVFPHEVREAISMLKKKWSMQKMKDTQIRLNLQKIGIPKQEIGIFYDKV